MSQPRVLVLGGTGHIGAAISRRFAAEGFQVFATGRQFRERPNLAGTMVTTLSGDDHDPVTLDSWIADSDVVIDAATPYPLWLHAEARRMVVRRALDRTHQILEKVESVQAAFIHISSFTTLPHKRGIVGQIKQGMIEGVHPYFELKSEVEACVRRKLCSGLNGCIVNPATCMGPYDLKPKEQTFIPMLLGGNVRGLVGSMLNVVDVRDVADVVWGAYASGFPDQQIPVFGHDATLPELADQICSFRGTSVPAARVPASIGTATLYWTETAYAATGRQTPWPSLPMLLLESSYSAQPSRAQTRICKNLRPLEDTLKDAISWYESINYL